MPLERGTLLNKRYRVVEILGQGGMGSVYRAIDENLGVDLAVKENLFTSMEYARQFRREATILASLRHPNLPRVTDHFEVDNRGQYLIMDYIEGEDLRERMDRDGRLREEEAIVIGAAICDALTYLHSRKPQVVHRDIKPGNVKIAPDGRIFLVDFGLAKVVEGSQVTTTGARAMTPGYSPPEQYGTARTDTRSDIYSLGATLYAALCGSLPEDGLARAMSQAELTPVRRHNAKISKRLAAVIEKSLSVLPDSRYQTAEEFKQALLSAANPSIRRATGELTVTPPPVIDDEAIPGTGSNGSSSIPDIAQPDQPQPLRPISKPQVEYPNEVKSRPRRSRPSGCLLSTLLLLLLVGGGSVLAYASMPDFRVQANRILSPVLPQSVITYFATPTPQNTPEPERPLTSPTPSATPTNTLVQVLAPEATATPTPTPTIAVESTATIPSVPTVSQTPEPAFLGNSNGEVAFVSNQTGIPQIWIINVDGVRFRQLTEMPGGACQPDWSPDGMRVVFISPCEERKEFYLGSILYTINADGTGLTQLLGGAAGDYDPAWSPDGSKIAFTTLRSTGKPQVYVLNLDDGSVSILAAEGLKNMQPRWSPDGRRIVYISTLEMGERVWIMNADGSDKQPFSGVNGLASSPDWSRDGNSIVYTYRENIGTIPNLIISPADTFAPQFFVEDGTPRRDARFSPDSLWLVFESWFPGDNHDIWIMSFDGKEIRVLRESSFYDFRPSWRPFIGLP